MELLLGYLGKNFCRGDYTMRLGGLLVTKPA